LFEDGLDIFHHLIVPEAQYPIATLCQEGRPPLIRFSLCGMLTAIELYNQTMLLATKVGNAAADRMLAAKLGAAELSCSEPRPEPPLGFGLLAAQSASAVPKFGGLCLHLLSPSP